MGAALLYNTSAQPDRYFMQRKYGLKAEDSDDAKLEAF
jgi:hypothetical protein